MPEHNDDIEKYFSGKLTTHERHQLEKKALSDPFLADALEGAESITGSEFSHDLDEIHQKISPRKRSTFFWPLRIAASVIVIVALIIVTQRLIDNEPNNQLALEKQKPAVYNQTIPKIGPAQPVPESSAAKAVQQGPVAESANRLPAQPAIIENLQSSPEEDRAKPDALPPPSQAGEDLAEPQVVTQAMDDKTSEQKTGFAKARESEDEKPASAPSKNIDRAANAPSAMRSTTSNKKSESLSGAGIAKDDAESTIVITEPLPVVGMAKFNKYVDDNLRYPQRALNNNIQGDVIIEFQINANGSYLNFEVIKGLGFGCDEEAIRLIKDGPAWNPVTEDGKVINNKPRVTIPFRIKKTSNE